MQVKSVKNDEIFKFIQDDVLNLLKDLKVSELPALVIMSQITSVYLKFIK